MWGICPMTNCILRLGDIEDFVNNLSDEQVQSIIDNWIATSEFYDDDSDWWAQYQSIDDLRFDIAYQLQEAQIDCSRDYLSDLNNPVINRLLNDPNRDIRNNTNIRGYLDEDLGVLDLDINGRTESYYVDDFEDVGYYRSFVDLPKDIEEMFFN